MSTKGWTDEEIANKNLMAPCGLYCGTCGIYLATRDENTKFKAVLSRMYGTPPEMTACLGCMQTSKDATIFGYCEMCAVRECAGEKGFYSCHQCEDWPCQHFTDFEFPIGVRVRERAIPSWQQKVSELGHEQGCVAWARSEVELYHCSGCGEPLFRGAQRCRACKKFVADELDGRP